MDTIDQPTDYMIPEELILNIMKFATIPVLGQLCRVNKTFNVLYRDNVIWKQKYNEICGFDIRPNTWRKYPWFLSVKAIMTRKYDLCVYKGTYSDHYQKILVSEHTNFGQFNLYQILNNKLITDRKSKIYLVQNICYEPGYSTIGPHARTFSELSNLLWWFDIFDKKSHNKTAINLVTV